MTFKGWFTTSIPSTFTITRTDTDIFFFHSHRNFSKKEKIRNKGSSRLYKFVHVCLQTVAKEIRKYSRLRNWRSFAQKRGNVEYSKGNFAGDFSARSASFSHCSWQLVNALALQIQFTGCKRKSRSAVLLGHYSG